MSVAYTFINNSFLPTEKDRISKFQFWGLQQDVNICPKNGELEVSRKSGSPFYLLLLVWSLKLNFLICKTEIVIPVLYTSQMYDKLDNHDLSTAK